MDITELTDISENSQTMQEIWSQIRSTSLTTLAKAAIILLVGILIAHIIISMLNKLLIKNGKIPKLIHTFIISAVRITLYIVAALSAANTIGISVSSFVALLSVLTLAVSLAIQGILSNVVGGVLVAINQPFQIGDFIEYDSLTGSVMEIELMQTKLFSPDGKIIYVPNSLIYSSKLINYNGYGKRRMDLSISASYDNPPDKVKQALQQAVEQCSNILDDPKHRIFLDSYEDSSIRYGVWVWVQSKDFLDAKQALSESIYYVFADNGITMTYPHLNVHLEKEINT